MSSSSETLEAAIFYSTVMNFKIFPLLPKLKIPYTGTRGFKDATSDQAIILKWFTDFPDANIGIATGRESGIIVVDVDPRNGGNYTLETMQANHGAYDTTTAITGGNGQHFIFRYPDGADIPSCKYGDGIDIKSDGGYIVAYPSIHPNGQRYEWEAESDPFEGVLPNDMPPLLLKELARESKPKNTGAKLIIIERNQYIAPHVIEELRQALKFLDCNDRDAWIKYGHALYSLDNDDTGFRIWDEWALKSDKYNARDMGKRWRGFSDRNSISYQTIFHDAQLAGWVNPKTAFVSNVSGGWRDIVKINSVLPEVQAFPMDALPDTFGGFVRDVSERMQNSPDFVAVSLMVALSSIVGNKFAIQPKQKDSGWVIVPNLWGALIGLPSTMKSPTLSEALKPLKALEQKEREAFKVALDTYQKDEQFNKLSLKNDESKAKKLLANGEEKEARELFNNEKKTSGKPTRKRYIVNDATVEKLGELLNENEHGLLLERDELAGFIASLEKADRQSDKAFYLEAWNGSQGFTYDRIGRGTIDIKASTMAIIGGIQPDKIKKQIEGAISGDASNDGFIQRF